eukprot:CAMPEP_0196663570 /NCGR_PEP_ID=MMETSP1086-20130531/53387_1 /TAXON_ID=77921 /ORGANISM="Cyanoptyche  gloeocystis , Strain SAG4.97" /LENGTH=404 /DNA_ID=CAMNT_0041999445 /DNA_START=40 /DNA_END=1254 /DNA_ORIENTATION=-
MTSAPSVPSAVGALVVEYSQEELCGQLSLLICDAESCTSCTKCPEIERVPNFPPGSGKVTLRIPIYNSFPPGVFNAFIRTSPKVDVGTVLHFGRPQGILTRNSPPYRSPVELACYVDQGTRELPYLIGAIYIGSFELDASFRLKWMLDPSDDSGYRRIQLTPKVLAPVASTCSPSVCESETDRLSERDSFEDSDFETRSEMDDHEMINQHLEVRGVRDKKLTSKRVLAADCEFDRSTKNGDCERSSKRKRSTVSELDISKVRTVFHLPINQAAESLGCCVTVIKKFCRNKNIQRWPQRKIASFKQWTHRLQDTLNDPDASAHQEELRKCLSQAEEALKALSESGHYDDKDGKDKGKQIMMDAKRLWTRLKSEPNTSMPREASFYERDALCDHMLSSHMSFPPFS